MSEIFEPERYELNEDYRAGYTAGKWKYLKDVRARVRLATYIGLIIGSSIGFIIGSVF